MKKYLNFRKVISEQIERNFSGRGDGKEKRYG